MNVENAKIQLRSLQENAKVNIDTDEIFKMDYEAIEIVLNELERKESIIDKMSYKIAKLNGTDQYCMKKAGDKICPFKIPTEKKCKECVKKYYEKGVKK